jgi:menaquinone-dependent protoporphyrinogen oxidase
MNVLIVHGSERGGTAGVAARVADALRAAGHRVDVAPARETRALDGYDAVLVGGALYAGAWHRDARRFVLRHAGALRTRLVWFFSSGPLDGSAAAAEIAPVDEVRALMDHVGAEGHATFGGRLAPGASGFVASRMARTRAGDWRDATHIAGWSAAVARQLTADTLRRANRPAVTPLPSTLPDVALTLFVGLSATAGGASLAARPDGSVLRMSVATLRHTPFHDFLAPGLLLVVLVGLPHLVAMRLHADRHPFAPVASLTAGAVLAVWIVAEALLLRTVLPVQLAYLLLGFGLVARSFREARAALPPPRAARAT